MTRTATIALLCLLLPPAATVSAMLCLQSSNSVWHALSEAKGVDACLQAISITPFASLRACHTGSFQITPGLLQLASDDPAVEAGREALSESGNHPWYDAQQDTLNRIDVKPQEVGFWEWFWNLFPDWNWGSGGGSGVGSGTSTFFQILAFGLIAIVALVLVFFLVRAFIKQDNFRLPPSAGNAKGDEAEGRRRIEALPFQIAADMSNLLEAARHYYERGEFGEAVKYLFSYQLVQLDRYNMIRMTRGKTNRQYLRELGRGHSLQPHVEETMTAFEDFFFGNRAIRRPRFEACWSRIENFDTHLASMQRNGENINPKRERGLSNQ